MNFANVKAITIPEGNVKQIADGQGVVLWKKNIGPNINIIDLFRRVYPVGGSTMYWPPSAGSTTVQPYDGTTFVSDGYYINPNRTSGSPLGGSSYIRPLGSKHTDSYTLFDVVFPVQAMGSCTSGQYGYNQFIIRIKPVNFAGKQLRISSSTEIAGGSGTNRVISFNILGYKNNTLQTIFLANTSVGTGTESVHNGVYLTNVDALDQDKVYNIQIVVDVQVKLNTSSWSAPSLDAAMVIGEEEGTTYSVVDCSTL